MKIQSRLLFGISLLLVLPLGYFVFDRIEFVRTAQHTSGIIEHVTGTNDRCGRKRSRHDCTMFRATLRYDVQGSQYRINVSAGNARGHDQPVSRSNYTIGAQEFVAYDPRRPSRAYRDKLWDVWGAPLVALFIQIGTFVASFAEQRRERPF